MLARHALVYTNIKERVFDQLLSMILAEAEDLVHGHINIAIGTKPLKGSNGDKKDLQLSLNVESPRGRLTGNNIIQGLQKSEKGNISPVLRRARFI